jgi:hypothetical protein
VETCQVEEDERTRDDLIEKAENDDLRTKSS